MISRPGSDRICFDLGHKAVAAERPIEDRVRFFDFPEEARPVLQAEEHLTFEVPDREAFQVGQELYGLPGHICPTVALHEEAVIVREGRATDERWAVVARKRRITV